MEEKIKNKLEEYYKKNKKIPYSTKVYGEKEDEIKPKFILRPLKFEDNKIVFPNITNDIQMKQITKLQELDLKDFYFDIRADEVNRCSLMGINSQLHSIQIQKKKIQDEKENIKNEIKENNLDDIEMEE